jgi:hypothetical protein
MGIMNGNPNDEPLHYGAVIGTWAFIGANNGCISGYEAFINHAGDNYLIRLHSTDKKKYIRQNV